jgi:hypothetical protein
MLFALLYEMPEIGEPVSSGSSIKMQPIDASPAVNADPELHLFLDEVRAHLKLENSQEMCAVTKRTTNNARETQTNDDDDNDNDTDDKLPKKVRKKKVLRWKSARE